MENDYPQISRPVGSSEEVDALQVPLRNIATCCERDANKALGCSMYGNCDREFRDTRPQNQIFTNVKKNGEIRTTHGACFEVVKLEIEAEMNGGYIEVIGGEGDVYESRGSVKKHPKRDPDCGDCQKGECVAYVDREDLEYLCPPFPPAEEHKELRKFARLRTARAKGKARERTAKKNSLLNNETKSKANVRKQEKASENPDT